MVERILANLEAYFPSIRKDLVAYRLVNETELIIELKDGSRFSFDNTNCSIRRLLSVNDIPTEADYKREFGIRLRRIMFNRDVSQKELERRTGIKQAQISYYLSGKQSPSFYKVEQIVRALNCSMDDLRLK